MLDGLLGRGYSSKCKSLMKLTKTRIDVIRRKRNATQRFLRKDVADLLSNGHDDNAYGRAEGLLVEVITLSCYDFVERCCDLVLQNLSIMQKQSECPDECKAAVASLMLAAARFSDLPELRDLRQMFYERYGDSLALFEDEAFKENLASTPSTLEKKVRLMREIASEFSIKWDYKAFEQRMKKPPVPPQDPRKAHRDFNLGPDKSKSCHGKDKVVNGDGPGNLLRERFGRPRNENDGSALKVDATRHGVSSNGHDKPVTVWDEPPVKKKDTYENSLHGRQNFYPDRQAQEPPKLKEDVMPRSVRSSGSSHRKIEPVDVGSKVLYGRENNAPIKDSRDALPHPKVPIIDSRDALPSANPEITTSHAKRNGKEKLPVKDEVAPKPKSYKNMVIPPPYVKHFDKAKVRKHDAHLGSDGGSDQNGVPKDHRRSNHLDGPERTDIHQDETANPIPKPRSSRRRHSRSRSFHNEAANFEEPALALPRKSRSKRKEDPRRGLQVLFDDEHHQKDDEERIIDKLLLHYSKKPTSGVPDPVRPRRSSKSRHAHRDQNGSRDGSDKEPSPQTSRSFSLPREHSGPSSATKVLSRAATFQLDRSEGARHVHPKLPDYDDLAARFAALRGR